MPIDLQNVSVLSYTQNSQFFGEAFRYQNQKSLSIEGVLFDVNNFDGVSGVASGIRAMFTGDQNYQNITINGYNFGNGKITNIRFNEGNDVRLKSYSADIICYETGNLFNLSGTQYTGIAPSTGNRYDLLDSLSENFSYNRNGESFGYNHSVSLKMSSGNGVTQSPITLAKSLAASLINSNTPFGMFTSGENQSLGLKTYNESYNVITNECSFSEEYQRPINTSGLLFTRTNSFDLGDNGISSVTENCSIKNISGNMNALNFNKLEQLVDTISSGSYARCSGIFTGYSEIGAYPLYTGYTAYSKNLSPFSNTAEYTINYTNNPAQVSGCSWSYVNEINKDGRYYNVSENGSIIGHGIPQDDGFYRAKNMFTNVKAGSYARAYSFYTGQANTPLNIKKISESSSRSQFEGNVQYNLGFSDNPVYMDGVSGVKSQEISVSDTIPTQLINKFEIFNVNEIVQPQNNSTMGARSLSLDFNLTRDANISTVKALAKTLANSYVPSGSDIYINNLSHNYSPIEKKFSLNVGWSFQREPTTVI